MHKPSAILFALGLAARLAAHGTAPVLFVQSAYDAGETGRLYGPGLAGLGLTPSRLILVETANQGEALWAIEEGLKSRALALVVGLVGSLEATPARRLSLSAGGGRTPALLITHHDAPGLNTAHTRWRVRARPSMAAGTAQGERGWGERWLAPGTPRFEICLERCRGRADAAAHDAGDTRGDGDTAAAKRSFDAVKRSFDLEWSDETHGFRLSAALADRENAAGGPKHAARHNASQACQPGRHARPAPP